MSNSAPKPHINMLIDAFAKHDSNRIWQDNAMSNADFVKEKIKALDKLKAIFADIIIFNEPNTSATALADMFDWSIKNE